MFCCFVDFEKAFDTVWRDGLWYKLLLNNMNGHMYNVISNMYKGTKSCIVYNKECSNYFPCCNGVRQGENLSPFLFSIYLNDLESFLSTCNLEGLISISDDLEEQFDIYLKLLTLLYADDTVLFSESYEELQKLLDAFEDYCSNLITGG